MVKHVLIPCIRSRQIAKTHKSVGIGVEWRFLDGTYGTYRTDGTYRMRLAGFQNGIALAIAIIDDM